MGSGFAPCSAWVIDWEKLLQIIPEKAKEFHDLLEECGTSLVEFCECTDRGYEVGKNEEAGARIQKEWSELEEEFKNKTQVGDSKLSLEPCYHDLDSGDIYDDMRGAFFIVGGVEEMTPAGRALGERICFARWVVFE